MTVFYVAINAVFLTAAPASELRGVLNVGSIAATHLIGPTGGRLMSGIISLGLLASISAMVWAGPRITQRIGEDYRFFRVLARTDTGGIPRRAILLQLFLVLALINMGSFESVLVCAQVPLLICLMLGVAGVMVIRKKGEVNCGFRCPYYPLPQLIFLLCSLGGLFYTVLSKPWMTLASLGAMIVPYLIYSRIEGLNSRSP